MSLIPEEDEDGSSTISEKSGEYCHSQTESYESGDVTRRIVLHVYDDESKEFTSLTTYHGMIRIYTSDTWPSRIFWSLVVVTCLTLFMIHSAMMLFFYHSHPTVLEVRELDPTVKFMPAITICELNLRAKKTNDMARLSFEEFLRDEQIASIPVFSEDDNDVMSMLDDYKSNCTDVIQKLYVGGRSVPNPCNSFETLLTDMGYCHSINHWPFTELRGSIRIDVKTNSRSRIVMQLHEAGNPYLMKSKGIRIKNGVRTSITVHTIRRTLLELGNWGTCSDDWVEDKAGDSGLYSNKICKDHCLAREFIINCGCVPFYAQITDANYPICTTRETLECKPSFEPKERCNCPVDCKSIIFRTTTPAYRRKLEQERNSTTVHLYFKKTRVQMQMQRKRLQAFELLSYVAGSMGLFLGMSCVTLLEIFIYLFKAVWGTLNDDRYSSYLEHVLGEEDKEDDRSHEEIVITQKVLAEIHREKRGSNAVIEENYAITTSELRRKNSVFRLQPRQSEFGLDTADYKMQLPKPTRRVSTIGII